MIGDGVSDDTRHVMAEFMSEHIPVKFLDKPKSIRHGEEYRGEVIRESDADYICYLGDDDLLFPGHIEAMLETILGVDFANPLPVFLEPDGTLSHVATDLSNTDSLKWHLSEKPLRNSVSLTGVIHTRSSYLELPFGWRSAPAGMPTDLYMWHQYFRLPGFKARTASCSTTAKFADSSRQNMSVMERGAELREFAKRFEHPEFISEWNLKVQDAIRNSATANLLQVEALRLEKIDLSQSLNDVLKSVSWRSTAPMRKLLGFLFR